METVITAAAVLLAIAGLGLVVDVGRIWRDDPRTIGGPERAQLLTGIAVLVFAVAFFAARGGEDEAPVAAPAPTATAVPGDAELTKLAAAARLPKLQAPERSPQRDRNRPRRPRPSQQEQPAPVEETTTTTPVTTTTTTPATTTPAPATTTPAPEPPPPAEETVPFDSRE